MESLLQHVRKSPFFSIVLDEAADISSQAARIGCVFNEQAKCSCRDSLSQTSGPD